MKKGSHSFTPHQYRSPSKGSMPQYVSWKSGPPQPTAGPRVAQPSNQASPFALVPIAGLQSGPHTEPYSATSFVHGTGAKTGQPRKSSPTTTGSTGVTPSSSPHERTRFGGLCGPASLQPATGIKKAITKNSARTELSDWRRGESRSTCRYRPLKTPAAARAGTAKPGAKRRQARAKRRVRQGGLRVGVGGRCN